MQSAGWLIQAQPRYKKRPVGESIRLCTRLYAGHPGSNHNTDNRFFYFSKMSRPFLGTAQPPIYGCRRFYRQAKCSQRVRLKTYFNPETKLRIKRAKPQIPFYSLTPCAEVTWLFVTAKQVTWPFRTLWPSVRQLQLNKPLLHLNC